METKEIAESEVLDLEEAQEKERLIMEAQRADRQAELELESQEQERINDEKHRSEVHRAIYIAINTAIHFAEQGNVRVATRLTQELIDGKIPHVTIQY